MTFPVKPTKGHPIRASLIREIIDCLRMFRPLYGRNITTQVTPGGTIINGKPSGSAGGADIAPWSVRKHASSSDSQEIQWEIWLPPGCMSVGGTLTPLNKPASETDGHEGDKPWWYAVHIDEQEGDDTTTTDGDTTTSVRTWDIVAHAKTSALLDGVDAIDKPPKRYLYVEARKVLTDQEYASQTKEQLAEGTWGDEFSQIIARVTVGTIATQGRDGEEGTTDTFRKITQLVSTPISVQGRAPGGFDLVWDFDFTEAGALAVKHVYCMRQIASAAGITLSGPGLTEVTGAQSTIYAKILTNPLNPENESSVEVVKDPQGAMSRDNFITWLRLYEMASNAVLADYRAQSLANVQVYR